MFKQINLVFLFISTVFLTSAFGNKKDSTLRVLEEYRSPCDEPCPADTAKVQLLIQSAFWYENTQYDSALYYYKEALDLAHRIGIANWKAKVLNNLGIAHYANDKHDKAIEYYIKALKIAEKLPQRKLEISVLNNIGVVYFAIGEFEQAVTYYSKARDWIEEHGNQQDLSVSYTNIGLVRRYQKKYSEATESYEKSLEIDRKLGDSLGMAYAFNNLGNVDKDQGKYASAIMCFQKASAIFKSQNDQSSLTVVYGNISSSHLLNKQYNLAISYAEKGLDLIRGKKAFSRAKELYAHLWEAYAGKGEYKQALNYYRKFTEAKDSIFDLERLRQVDAITQHYENEKQARINAELKEENALQELVLSEKSRSRTQWIYAAIIAILIGVVAIFRVQIRRKNNWELRSKNEQIIRQKLQLTESLDQQNKLNGDLQESNKAKDKFFSILAHDLKAPLISIEQAIGMVHEHYDSFTKDEIKKYLGKLKGSSEQANNLLVNLLDWSLSQKGLIGFKPEEQDLVQVVSQNVKLKTPIAEQKKIRLDWNQPEAILLPFDHGMIDTVVRNLISNAIKFTSGEGLVEVILDRQQDWVRLIVKDNGIGMNEDKRQRLFRIDVASSDKGTDGESGTGLGLILCKEFIEKHGGQIDVRSVEGKGSEFWFELPLSNESRIT